MKVRPMQVKIVKYNRMRAPSKAYRVQGPVLLNKGISPGVGLITRSAAVQVYAINTTVGCREIDMSVDIRQLALQQYRDDLYYFRSCFPQAQS